MTSNSLYTFDVAHIRAFCGGVLVCNFGYYNLETMSRETQALINNREITYIKNSNGVISGWEAIGGDNPLVSIISALRSHLDLLDPYSSYLFTDCLGGHIDRMFKKWDGEQFECAGFMWNVSMGPVFINANSGNRIRYYTIYQTEDLNEEEEHEVVEEYDVEEPF